MVAFQVGPEVPGQHRGQLAQVGVVLSLGALGEVVDQQVPDRVAGDLVALDQIGGTARSGGARRAQARWRVGREHCQVAQHPVGQRCGTNFGIGCLVVLEQLKQIPDRDVVDGAALGHDDVGQQPDHPVPHRVGDQRIGTAELIGSLESGRVHDLLGNCPGCSGLQLAHHPRVGGTDHAATDDQVHAHPQFPLMADGRAVPLCGQPPHG